MDRHLSASRRPQYDWASWTDGDAWKLLRGENYLVSDRAFRSAAHACAKSHSLRLTTQIVDGGIVIRFNPA